MAKQPVSPSVTFVIAANHRGITVGGASFKAHIAFGLEEGNTARLATARSWCGYNGGVLKEVTVPNGQFRFTLLSLERRQQGGRAWKVMADIGDDDTPPLLLDMRDDALVEAVAKGMKPGAMFNAQFGLIGTKFYPVGGETWGKHNPELVKKEKDAEKAKVKAARMTVRGGQPAVYDGPGCRNVLMGEVTALIPTGSDGAWTGWEVRKLTLWGGTWSTHRETYDAVLASVFPAPGGLVDAEVRCTPRNVTSKTCELPVPADHIFTWLKEWRDVATPDNCVADRPREPTYHHRVTSSAPVGKPLQYRIEQFQLAVVLATACPVGTRPEKVWETGAAFLQKLDITHMGMSKDIAATVAGLAAAQYPTSRAG